MHPTSDEMLALRDGNAGPEVAAHVNDCERCAGELERLDGLREGLRGLPLLQPRPGGWEVIRAAAQRRQELRRRRRWAAAVAALVAGVSLWIGVGPLNLFQPGADSEIVESSDLEALIAASSQLERALQVPSLRTRVLTPREAARIVVIEDQIALIDLRLERPATEVPNRRAVELWSDRVELLDALVRARGGPTSPAINRNASFQEERSWQ
jgi:hypothetical protein